MKNRDPNFLFVYGSLRSNIRHPMSKLLHKHGEHQGAATFNGKLYDVGSFPAAIPSEVNNDTVHGELFELDTPDIIFEKLDKYEGYDPLNPGQSLYLRHTATIQQPEKENIKAWIYLYNRSVNQLTPIPDGDYLSYLDNSK